MSKPPGKPQGKPPAKKRVETRPVMSFRGKEFSPEFRSTVMKAATKLGVTQSKFVADVLSRAAQRVLKGEALEETAQPPARRDDELTATLAGIQIELENMRAAQTELSAEQKRLAELSRGRYGGWMGRLRARFQARPPAE